ncbi:hypothetical protein WR25_12957 [Diploscapter pachys]|uniref:Uncharacterized protein n=1 Tax=Diploscapter pachys TaxID=2018661 RepID=A0A2A2K316_9BILA|nr:hypothetical protein WR25_12957 [Diploscapter pachys]
MRVGDMKRAVEDVILRPDENHTGELQKRSTIAALDLSLRFAVTDSSHDPFRRHNQCLFVFVGSRRSTRRSPAATPSLHEHQSGHDYPDDKVDISDSSSNRLLVTFKSCTIKIMKVQVNRPQPIFYRHSAGVSRRQSRVLGNLHSKRKRSNSLTNYHKSQGISVSLPPSSRQTPLRFGNEEEVFRNSLGSSESHSSVARSEAEDCFQDFVPEEDESAIVQAHMAMVMAMGTTCQMPSTVPTVPLTPSHSLASSSSSNPFSNYRQRTDEDEDMECD